MHPDTQRYLRTQPSLISIPGPDSEFYIQGHLQISVCREQMYFQIPYINNFAYSLQFIHIAIARGRMHILRSAWVIVVLCPNLSWCTGRSTSLCNIHCTAISTAVRRENLLVPTSPPSRNCLVSISSAINLSEKQVLSFFLLPSSFSSLLKSTRVRTVGAWSCVMLSPGLCLEGECWRAEQGSRTVWDSSLTPFVSHWESNSGMAKTTISNKNSPWWLPADGAYRGHAFLHLDWLLFLMFTSLCCLLFPKELPWSPKLHKTFRMHTFIQKASILYLCLPAF